MAGSSGRRMFGRSGADPALPVGESQRERAPGRGEGTKVIERFDRVERWIHWTNASLFAVMIFTAGCLYFSPLSTLVGRRELVRTVHVYTGLFLPVPIVAGLRSEEGRVGKECRSRWSPYH